MRRLLSLVLAFLASIPAFSQVSFNVNRLPHSLNLVGDFNNDGREDGIAFTGDNGGFTFGFHVVKSTGTGTYTDGPSYTFPNGESMFVYAAGDFNNDSKLDIV